MTYTEAEMQEARQNPRAGDVWEWPAHGIIRRVTAITGGVVYYDSESDGGFLYKLPQYLGLWAWYCERGGRLVKRGAPAGAEEVGGMSLRKAIAPRKFRHIWQSAQVHPEMAGKFCDIGRDPDEDAVYVLFAGGRCLRLTEEFVADTPGLWREADEG